MQVNPIPLGGLERSVDSAMNLAGPGEEYRTAVHLVFLVIDAKAEIAIDDEMSFVNPRMRVRDQGIGKRVKQVHLAHERQLLQERAAAAVRLVMLPIGKEPIRLPGNELHVPAG